MQYDERLTALLERCTRRIARTQDPAALATWGRMWARLHARWRVAVLTSSQYLCPRCGMSSYHAGGRPVCCHCGKPALARPADPDAFGPIPAEQTTPDAVDAALAAAEEAEDGIDLGALPCGPLTDLSVYAAEARLGTTC